MHLDTYKTKFASQFGMGVIGGDQILDQNYELLLTQWLQIGIHRIYLRLSKEKTFDIITY